MPIKIAVGFLFVGLSLPILVPYFGTVLAHLIRFVEQAVLSIAHS
jgi:hypothetical protein